MKRSFLLLALLALCCNVMSQSLPLFEEGKCWSVDDTLWGEKVLATSTFVVRGDSVVNGKIYKKVYVTQKEDFKDLTLYYLGRDEDGVAYIYDDGIEHCFFDFNLEVGDEYISELGKLASAADDCKYVVKEVTTIETQDGVVRKCFVVDVYEYWADAFDPGWRESPYPFTFIEGIGEARFGLDVDYCIGCTGGGVTKLRCVHNAAGYHIYGTGENCNKLSVDTIKGECENGGVVYDLHGKQLDDKPQKGVYIKSGRKHLKRK